MMNARAPKRPRQVKTGSSATKHLRLFFYPLNLYVGYPTVAQVQNPEEFKTLQENASEQHARLPKLSPRFSTFDCEDPLRSVTVPSIYGTFTLDETIFRGIKELTPET